MSREPTSPELARIREWPHSDFAGWMKYIAEIWAYPDHITNKDGVWHVSTGGWSGHEDIIEAMQANNTLWLLHWYSSRRGGHYQFRTRSARTNASDGPEQLTIDSPYRFTIGEPDDHGDRLVTAHHGAIIVLDGVLTESARRARGHTRDGVDVCMYTSFGSRHGEAEPKCPDERGRRWLHCEKARAEIEAIETRKAKLAKMRALDEELHLWGGEPATCGPYWLHRCGFNTAVTKDANGWFRDADAHPFTPRSSDQYRERWEPTPPKETKEQT